MEEELHRFDLHIHSYYSDGTVSPEQIVSMAARAKLSLIALSDHDTVSGVGEAVRAGQKYAVKVMPAVEFDNEWAHELHILGLDVDLEHPVLQRAMEVARERRDRRNAGIFTRLKEAGVDAEPFMQKGQSSTTKLHIAHALIKGGYASEVKEAFAKYLRPGAPGYYVEKRFTPRQVMEIIHRSDGIPVLAHPCHIRENFYGLLRELISYGLMGIEGFYPSNTAKQTEQYLAIGEQYHLMVTCGSDFHGANRPGVPLGCAWRENKILEKTYSTLMKRMET